MTARTAILVAALGGQGGGVLTDWIVEAARGEGLIAQATSIPGVSQRTGATTYYVELARRAQSGAVPILGLAPMPGRVDVLLSAELLEAARMLERGFCTPTRTSVVASTHRVYTTREKMSAGEGRYDAARIVAALQALSARTVLFDMEALRARHGAAIGAVLFGALAGSGAAPISRQACEDAIAASGKGVTSSLLAFAEAFEQARGIAAIASPRSSSAERGREAREAQGGAESVASAGTGRSGEAMAPALASRIGGWPARVGEFARIGAAELIDYQGRAYAATYVDRVERVLAADRAPYDVAREAARFLALWMRYDDLIRVASRKARQARIAGIRAEAGAGARDVVRVYDFFKPGALEVAAVLPRGIGAWLEARALARRANTARPNRGGITLQASSIRGALALRLLAALRPLRPFSLRFAREQQAIGQWVDAVVAALQSGHADAAFELATLPRLIRGYGDTHANGRGNFERILAAWRATSARDASEAARTLHDDAEAAFNGTGCGPKPPSSPAARSAAASSPA